MMDNPDVTAWDMVKIRPALDEILLEHGFTHLDSRSDKLEFLLRLRFVVDGEQRALSSEILELYIGWHVPRVMCSTGKPVVIDRDIFA